MNNATNSSVFKILFWVRRVGTFFKKVSVSYPVVWRTRRFGTDTGKKNPPFIFFQKKYSALYLLLKKKDHTMKGI